MNPELYIQNVEVVSITPTTVRMIVHLHDKTPADLGNPEVQVLVAAQSKRACDYLRKEGFLENLAKEWKLSVGVMVKKTTTTI